MMCYSKEMDMWTLLYVGPIKGFKF